MQARVRRCGCRPSVHRPDTDCSDMGGVLRRIRRGGGLMAQQSFIWTALPNGYTADNSGLRLSMMLAPRLDPQDPLGQPQKLSTFFPDWQDWPATLANARFDIAFGGQSISVLARTTTGPNRVDSRLG